MIIISHFVSSDCLIVYPLASWSVYLFVPFCLSTSLSIYYAVRLSGYLSSCLSNWLSFSILLLFVSFVCCVFLVWVDWEFIERILPIQQGPETKTLAQVNKIDKIAKNLFPPSTFFPFCFPNAPTCFPYRPRAWWSSFHYFCSFFLSDANFISTFILLHSRCVKSRTDERWGRARGLCWEGA